MIEKALKFVGAFSVSLFFPITEGYVTRLQASALFDKSKQWVYIYYLNKLSENKVRLFIMSYFFTRI